MEYVQKQGKIIEPYIFVKFSPQMCKNSAVFSQKFFIGFLAQISAEKPTLFSSMIAWCKHVPMFLFVVNNWLKLFLRIHFNFYPTPFSRQNLFGIFIFHNMGIMFTERMIVQKGFEPTEIMQKQNSIVVHLSKDL